MAKLLVVVLLLSLLIYAATAWDAESFFNFKSCPPNQCSKHGPKVRFPLRLASQSPSCGTPLMELSCSGQDTILYHPVLGSCKVTAISYKHAAMSIILLVDSTPHCPLQKLISTNLSTDVYKPQKLEAASLPDCKVVSNGIQAPSTFKETENGVIGVDELVFTWYSSDITRDCQKCENEGKHCGFSSQRGRAFCNYGIFSF
ncbi:hypothetical protein OsJ_00144 [Oryza sativa Japonica Group]|uniref:RING-type E3 ubiquitin transferase n=1 Tax=Oryza sativa subsp. japonica TaxID=39947 RepID=A2ZNL2_ORYSJ|nr:hypothetical protein OsJ_00144 [Oryza sativa Japonica Group]